MIIRKATLKDSEEIIKLWEEFMKYHDCMVIKQDSRLKSQLPKKKDALKIFKKYVESRIKSRNAQINVAEDKGKLIAYSIIYVDKNIPIFKVERLGYVADLYVKKEYQGRNIATQFKNLALEFFKKKKIKDLAIRVYPSNTHAHNIYKKWGFFDFHIEMRKRL